MTDSSPLDQYFVEALHGKLIDNKEYQTVDPWDGYDEIPSYLRYTKWQPSEAEQFRADRTITSFNVDNKVI